MNILLVISALECGGAESHLCTLADKLKKRGNTVVVASTGGKMVPLLKNFGVVHYYAELDSVSPRGIFSAYARLSDIVKREDIDIIHAHSRLAAFISYFVAKRYGKAFTVTAHAKFRACEPYRSLSKWGRVCIAVSEDIRQYLIDFYHLNGDNIRVIGNFSIFN